MNLRPRLVLPVFALALFTSAALMFAVQPMVGKMLLPLAGGSPSGWIVAMAFFQCMLLAGYLLAHLLSGLSPYRQGIVYLLMLGVGMLALPVRLPVTATANIDAIGILTLLCRHAALPFIALSATSSTLQRLFTQSGHAQAKDPYFLYAASNLGSFAGLFAYPLLAEPLLGLAAQAAWWQAGFTGLLLVAAACLGLTPRRTESAVGEIHTDDNAGQKPALRLQVEWLLLSLVPSSLLMGVTTHVTTDILSVPMLWVAPLALYLLTFVIAFGGGKMGHIAQKISVLHPAAVFAIVVLTMIKIQSPLTVSWPAIFMHLTAFFIIALACHQKLVGLRPDDSTRHLTRFYLMLSVGGAVGGIFNAFIAPFLFLTPFEYTLVAFLSLLLSPALRKGYTNEALVFAAGGLVCAAIALAIFIFQPTFVEEKQRLTLIGGLLLSAFVLTAGNVRSTLVFSFLTMLFCANIQSEKIITQARNFYGVIKVSERKYISAGQTETLRVIKHGTTVHGTQFVAGAKKTQPLSYYSRKGPVGDLFARLKPRNVAVIGLGSGAINCYATPQMAMSFIEIDPAVVDIAQKYFSYLSDCKGRTAPRLITGDGRLEIERLPKGETFDMIMLDAFTSDAIPVHLLTREAFEGYAARLKPGGVIALHLSNRYFNLVPPVAAAAQAAGLESRSRFYNSKDDSNVITSSTLWMAVAPASDSAALKRLSAAGWEVPQPASPEKRVWSDDYSYLLDWLK